jgi:hypothetical protein
MACPKDLGWTHGLDDEIQLRICGYVIPEEEVIFK